MNAKLAALIEAFAARHALSPRERQVINLAVEGAGAKEMAQDLACSPRTVEEYWKRIFGKIGVRSRAAAMAELLRLATTEVARDDSKAI